MKTLSFVWLYSQLEKPHLVAAMSVQFLAEGEKKERERRQQNDLQVEKKLELHGNDQWNIAFMERLCFMCFISFLFPSLITLPARRTVTNHNALLTQ